MERALIYFDHDKAELTQQSKAILDSLLEKVESKEIIEIEINGHTDGDGSDNYNKKLSQNRAITVQQYITSKGISNAKIKSHYFGEEMPSSTNNTEDGKQKNRRVEVVIRYKDKIETVKTKPTDSIKTKIPILIPDKDLQMPDTGLGKIYFENKEVILNTCLVTVAIFDAGVEDFDTVSLYFNSQPIIDKQELKRKPGTSCIRVLHLNPRQSDTLISKAWNYGKESINTLKIEIYEGDVTDSNGLLKKNKEPISVKIMNSKPGLSSALLLKCK